MSNYLNTFDERINEKSRGEIIFEMCFPEAQRMDCKCIVDYKLNDDYYEVKTCVNHLKFKNYNYINYIKFSEKNKLNLFIVFLSNWEHKPKTYLISFEQFTKLIVNKELKVLPDGISYFEINTQDLIGYRYYNDKVI